jgi:acetoacetyl-CoA synthetase
MLFDGSPFAPTEKVLFDYAEQERFTMLRHLGQVHRRRPQGRLVPAKTPMTCLAQAAPSTGSPLSPEGFLCL